MQSRTFIDVAKPLCFVKKVQHKRYIKRPSTLNLMMLLSKLEFNLGQVDLFLKFKIQH